MMDRRDVEKELLEDVIGGGIIALYQGKENENNFLEKLHPESRCAYQRIIQSAWETKEKYENVCLVKLEDGYCDMRDIGMVALEADGSEVLLIVRSKMVYSLSQSQYEVIENWMNYIPGGVCLVAPEGGYHLEYGNEEFYRLIGYSKEELREEKASNLYTVIDPRDIGMVTTQIEELLVNSKNEIQMEHRMQKRDGSIVWIFVKGIVTRSHDKISIWCSVMDITERRRIEEEIRISEERFRIALEQTDNTLFEYDIQKRMMLHADRSANIYGLKRITENVPECLIEQGIVHQESKEAYLEVYRKIRTGSKKATALIRVKTEYGDFVWRKIMMNAIFDENGIPVHAIGILEDVDEQIRREESLRYQTQRDILTGLYNRGYMLEQIRESLAGRKQGGFQTLFVLDIDDFKHVNDQHGHMFGDFVLSECAQRIAALFRKEELVGRIGGDEFLVFIKDLHGPQEAFKCAERIINTFSKELCDQGKTITVTCSIGLAIAPMHGESFEVLYQNADSALYEAKKRGKNKVCGYQSNQ